MTMNYWILYNIVLTRFFIFNLANFVTTVVLDLQCILSIYLACVPYQHDLSVHQTCHQIPWQHQLGNYALISLPRGHDLKQTMATKIYLVTKGNTVT